MAILIHDPTYGALSGITGLKAPYPSPRTPKEAQDNLKFFREQTGLSQKKAALTLKIPQKTWEQWEHAQPSKGLRPIYPQHIARVASFLKCNPDLINPACPQLYKNTYTKYPPVLRNGDRLSCIEHPFSLEDVINNVNYFLALSDLSLVEVAARLECSQGALSRWRIDTPLKEETAIELAKVLQCPKELIYLDRIDLPPENRGPKVVETGLKLISPVTNMKDVKNNYAYYIAKAKLTPRDVARLIGLNDDVSSAQQVRNWKRPNMSSYMDVSQALTFANRLNIPVNDIMPIYQQQAAAKSLKTNVKNLSKLDSSNDILALVVKTAASGGQVLELEPSQCQESLGELLELPTKSGALAAAIVIGDSMYDYESGEGLADGSYILVDISQRNFMEALDRVVCFRINGNEVLVKRLKLIKGHLCFWSDNPRYVPRYHAMPRDADLLGVVLTSFNKVR